MSDINQEAHDQAYDDRHRDGIQKSRYITDAVRRRYLDGRKNAIVKIYFYIERGLAMVNEFKYVIAGILALYFALELDNIILIPIIFLIVVPVLWLIGYIWITYAVKSMEWINIEYATFWTRYNYALQEKQLENLESLTEQITRLNDNLERQEKREDNKTK